MSDWLYRRTHVRLAVQAYTCQVVQFPRCTGAHCLVVQTSCWTVFPIFWLYCTGYIVFWLHSCYVVQLSGCHVVQFSGCTAARLCSLLVVQFSGFIVFWLNRCTVVRFYSFLVEQVYSSQFVLSYSYQVLQFAGCTGSQC